MAMNSTVDCSVWSACRTGTTRRLSALSCYTKTSGMEIATVLAFDQNGPRRDSSRVREAVHIRR